MNQPQPSGVALAVSILRDAYPRADFPDRSAKLYGSMLADLDDVAVAEAVRRLVRRSQWLPTIAEIRMEVAEAKLDLPDAVTAWELVNSGRPVLALPEIVGDALVAVGGKYAIRTSEQPSILRSQFMKDYESRRSLALRRAVGAVAVSPTLAALPVSTAMEPRPLVARMGRSLTVEGVGEPTEAEISDAISILRAGPLTGFDNPASDPIYVAAEGLLAEYGV